MSYEVKGKLKKVLPVQTGTPKAGGEDWKKVSFVVSNQGGYEGREQLFCFEIFGAEKVDNFNKFNKEGSEVLVKFEIRTNEYQGKYYTSLSAYRVDSGERVEQAHQTPLAGTNYNGEYSDDPF
jgi:single-stranded DNA-binding protein